MLVYMVIDALHDSKECLLYPHSRHSLLSCKASPTLVQGIRTSVRRHRYKRTPCFAMSGWQSHPYDHRDSWLPGRFSWSLSSFDGETVYNTDWRSRGIVAATWRSPPDGGAKPVGSQY